MKKLIALSIIASAIGSTLALADDAQPNANDKSNAVVQQLAENQSGTNAVAPPQDATKQAPAKKTKKHYRHHAKKQAPKKADNVTADATPADTQPTP